MGKPVHLAKVSKEYGDSWAYCTQWSSRIVACTLFARAVTCKLCKRMKVYKEALKAQHDKPEPCLDCGEMIAPSLTHLCPDERTRNAVAKPDYYTSGTYKEGQDPEVTCETCKKTFLCDAMDSACRLCGEWFSAEYRKKYGSNRKVAQDANRKPENADSP